MRFARRVFALAGWSGLAMMVPMYFLEARIGQDNPPAITHPEFYYGMIGVTLAWQIAFLIVASDPIRFRPLMSAAVVEKFTFVVAVVVLVAQGRCGASIVPFAAFDAVLGTLFVESFRRTREE